MSTSSKKSQAKRSQGLIPEQYQSVALMGVLVLSIIVFLSGAFFGGSFNASDNAASNSFVPYLEQAEEFPLWNPHIFSGLPSYGSLLTTGHRWWDVITEVFIGATRAFGAMFDSDAARVSVTYMIYAIGMFLLMRSKKHNRFVSFFTAFAAVFSTFVIVWIMIGHNTKPIALMTFPWILMCLERLREKFTVTYLTVLIIAVHLMVESTHIQMVFYGVLAFGLYLLFEFAARMVKKETITGVARSTGALVVAGILSFMMASDRYLSVLEYTPHSTRSTAPITAVEGAQGDGGHDKSYATQWSFSPEEIITFLVPNYFGYGKLEYKGPATGNRPQVVHTYWGQMPFTDAANYMGIFVLALAIIGVWYFRKNVFVAFLAFLGAFSLLLSFGGNSPSFLYDLFFDIVPGFNKFRAPSMVLVLLQFAVPILAGYGLTAFIELRNRNKAAATRVVNIALASMGMFLVAGLGFNAVSGDAYMEAVQAKFGDNYPPAIIQFIYESAASDWLVTAALGIVAFLVIRLWISGTLSGGKYALVMCLLLAIDLWRVDFRAMEIDDRSLSETVFVQTDITRYLQQDQSVFRIVDFTQFGNGNVPAYHGLNSIHGYHSAKLRIYQDLMDVAGGSNGSAIVNPFLWNLLNVKYIVADQNIGMPPQFTSQQLQNTSVYGNPGKLPWAFFVDSYEVAEPMTILEHLRDGDFDPRETMFLEEPISKAVEPAGVENEAVVTSYENERIEANVKSTTTSLLFISEIFYDEGWTATLDGEEVDILKSNFAFRGIVVPPGEHKLVLEFTSEAFETGKILSMAGNAITLALVVFSVFIERKKEPKPATD